MRKKALFLLFISICIAPFIYSFLGSKKNVVIKEGWATEKLASMSLEQKIGQFFMVAAYPNKGDEHMKEVLQIIKENGVGSVIWFPKNKESYLKYADILQKSSEQIPLLYGLDAEWGISMRMDDEERFPYAYSIGAANDLKVSQKLAEMMAYECAELGIHFNFSPVADVNSNPNNPVIGFRSFGEDKNAVAQQVATFVKGFESAGVYSSLKHFPGHGDTDVDSHLDLPTIQSSESELMQGEWIPFKEGIKAGATSVMVGHLNVPKLDPSGTPSSLSKKIIQDYLKGKLGFKGIVISDALNMKAIADRYDKGEAAVKAFEAGCDILVYSENVKEAVKAIKKKVESGAISESEINERCLKILKLKEKSFIKPVKGTSYTQGEVNWAKNQLFEKSTALLKNKNEVLPFDDLNTKILHIAVGSKPIEFSKVVDEYAMIKHEYLSFDQVEKGITLKLDGYDKVIITLHATTVRPKDNFGMPRNLGGLFEQLKDQSKNTVVVFGNPLALSKEYDLSNVNALVVAYENNKFVQNRVAQQLFGAIPFVGKLPFNIGALYSVNDGITTQTNGRLKFSQPEELGIDPNKLLQIDQIVSNAINAKSFPGCQIIAAIDGKIFFRKNYGSQAYNEQKVEDDIIYDIASISKIAGSTAALMKLQTDGKFSLEKRFNEYLPDLMNGTALGSLKVREMMAHQAGLKAWIPFYKSTVLGGKPNFAIYSSAEKVNYVQVAKNLYLHKSYFDTIQKRILTEPLGAKRYLYSDLGYYFIKSIVEQESKMGLDEYVTKEIYSKMGLHKMMYNPYLSFDLNKIAPTEDDKLFRSQLIRGYVHDPGAAMIGGVGGHAGLFSNSFELAALMQMFLNDGYYGGVQILDPKVVAEYTRAQFPGNRRGAGFDKPILGSGGGTCDETSSQASYGHSGFTGTLAWVDPKNKLNYVFLSNRVYPDAENKKLISMGTRTQIQRILNEAIATRKL